MSAPLRAWFGIVVVQPKCIPLPGITGAATMPTMAQWQQDSQRPVLVNRDMMPNSAYR